MTRQLYPGDIVRRNTDDQYWILIDYKDHGNNIITMNFFVPQCNKVIQYTNPWDSCLPSPQFTVL